MEAAGPVPATRIFVGIAGWSIAARHAAAFQGEGTHLQRIARQLTCAEINTSFYRPHRRQTYERWAASTPEGFRFSVKLPRGISHGGFADADALLRRFLDEIAGLGDRLGVVLVQTPPSLAYSVQARHFLERLRSNVPAVAVEPRHESWSGTDALSFLREADIARVAADPSRIPGGGEPGGSSSFAYFRFHGSPRVYWSAYDVEAIAGIAGRLGDAARRGQVWCIFDNTAGGHAAPDALATLRQITLSSRTGRPSRMRR